MAGKKRKVYQPSEEIEHPRTVILGNLEINCIITVLLRLRDYGLVDKEMSEPSDRAAFDRGAERLSRAVGLKPGNFLAELLPCDVPPVWVEDSD